MVNLYIYIYYLKCFCSFASNVREEGIIYVLQMVVEVTKLEEKKFSVQTLS